MGIPVCFCSKVAFHMNKTLKIWAKSVQLPYANEAKLLSDVVLMK